MTHVSYRAQIIRLYLRLPGAPAAATNHDWIVAAELQRRSVPLELVAHALRLATLRRQSAHSAKPVEAIHSLAYFRRVIENLTTDELDPDYVAYVEERFRRLTAKSASSETAAHSQNTAVSESR